MPYFLFRVWSPCQPSQRIGLALASIHISPLAGGLILRPSLRWLTIILVFLLLSACSNTPPTPPTTTGPPTEPPPPTATAVPEPTDTPPTPIPTSAPVSPFHAKWDIELDRTIWVQRLESDEDRFWLDRQPLVLIGCYTGLQQALPDRDGWHVFGSTADFSRAHYYAMVRGFKPRPVKGQCLQMAVQYTSKESFCYSRIAAMDRGCLGWEQSTPQFQLIDQDAVQKR